MDMQDMQQVHAIACLTLKVRIRICVALDNWPTVYEPAPWIDRNAHGNARLLLQCTERQAALAKRNSAPRLRHASGGSSGRDP